MVEHTYNATTLLQEQTDSLHQDDVRTIVRLLAEVASLRDNHIAQKRALIQGLTHLVSADYWVWNVMRFEPDSPPLALSIMHTLPDNALTAITSSNHQFPDHPVNNAILKLSQTGSHWTRLLTQLLDTPPFNQTTLYSRYFQHAALGDTICSVYPIPSQPQNFSYISIFRTPDKPNFTEREALIIHIITSEVPWLHELNLPQSDGSQKRQLPPRLQTVFTLLMDGQAPKQIAQNLNLTENTIRTYIRKIYKHFNVTSRAQLTRRFTTGDGNHN